MKKSIAILLVLLLLLPVLSVQAFAADAPMSWSLMDGGVLVISGDGEMRDLSQTIAPWRDYEKQIEELQVEDGVTGIGNQAFQRLRSLKVVSLPESVERIGNGAFYYDIALEKIQLPSGLKLLNTSVFDHCSSLKSIVLPDGLEEIGAAAFNCCSGMEYLYIPASVKEIGDSAFAGCWHIKNVFFGGTEEEWKAIQMGNFNRYLTKAALTCDAVPSEIIAAQEADEAMKPAEISWEISKDNVLTVSGNGRMPDYFTSQAPWYDGKKDVVKIVVEDGITHIGSQAFQYFAKVKSVSLPASVTSIGASAFYECNGLQSIELPAGLTELGEKAFDHCGKLTSVEIPESLTAIPHGAFDACWALETLKLPGTLTKIGDYAFSSCGNLKDVWYDGSAADWTAVEVGAGNTAITNAYFHTAGNGTAGMAGGVF